MHKVLVSLGMVGVLLGLSGVALAQQSTGGSPQTTENYPAQVTAVSTDKPPAWLIVKRIQGADQAGWETVRFTLADKDKDL
jgi:hypothetical protein